MAVVQVAVGGVVRMIVVVRVTLRVIMAVAMAVIMAMVVVVVVVMPVIVAVPVIVTVVVIVRMHGAVSVTMHRLSLDLRFAVAATADRAHGLLRQ